jgi:hypothetical protein
VLGLIVSPPAVFHRCNVLFISENISPSLLSPAECLQATSSGKTKTKTEIHHQANKAPRPACKGVFPGGLVVWLVRAMFGYVVFFAGFPVLAHIENR